MASGCTASNSSFNLTLFGKPISDQTVEYTGPAIPALGICTHDRLNEIEAIILQKLIDYSTGVGIHIPDIDLSACTLFTEYVTCCNGCDDLPCLMKIIFESLCVLDTRLTTVEDFITALQSGPYYTACLTLPANPTLKQIIQQLLIEFCALKTRVSTLETTVANISSNLNTNIGNFLLGHVNSCQTDAVVKTGTGATANVQLAGFVPVGGIILFAGNTSWFDATGKGYANMPACGFALCNGNNGTVDMKGNVPVGATTMGGLPLTSITMGASYNLNDVGGEIKHTLVPGEIPSIGFTGTTTPSTAAVVTPDVYENGFKSSVSGNNGVGLTSAGSFQPSVGLKVNIPSLTVNGTLAGGGTSHENRMPYRALFYIQRIY